MEVNSLIYSLVIFMDAEVKLIIVLLYNINVELLISVYMYLFCDMKDDDWTSLFMKPPYQSGIIFTPD